MSMTFDILATKFLHTALYVVDNFAQPAEYILYYVLRDQIST